MATSNFSCVRRLRVAWLAVGLSMAAAAFPAAPGLAAPAAKQDLGKPLADEAAAHFKAGRFQQAAELFERAFALNPEKLVRLRNAGRAYEEAGRLEYAKLLFERYVQQAPDGADKDEVKQRVTHIDKTLEARKQAELDIARKAAAAEAKALADSATTTATAVAGTASAADWATLGGGVAMLAGGAVWSVWTVQAEQQKNSAIAKGHYSYPGGEAKKEADRATILKNQIGAYATLGIGVLATGVGVWWTFLAPARAAPVAWAPVPLADGGALVVTGQF